MSQNKKFELLSPFGPVILKTTLPTTTVKRANILIDLVVQDRIELESRDWAKNLAGNVSREINVIDIIRSDLDLHKFIIQSAKRYALSIPNLMLGSVYGSSESLSFHLNVQDAWVNEMISGDYNPVHYHPNSHISCVSFLRLPDNYNQELEQEPLNKRTSGCLQLIDSRTVSGASNMYLIKPKVGDFYIFPSWMLHCVYPFRSTGIRRSFSANIAIHSQGPIE